ncbi:hypothetical protein Tco_0011802 [Tanacetum coccineum]
MCPRSAHQDPVLTPKAKLLYIRLILLLHMGGSWKRSNHLVNREELLKVAIITRWLPFEFIISSRSTELMVERQMAATAQNTNNTTIRSEGKLALLEQPLIPIHLLVASQAVCDTYEVLYDAQNEVACLMLVSMSPDLQRALENYKAYDMIQELKTMFGEQAKHELFDTVKVFHACKQEDGQSVSAYILKMKGYFDTLECLGYVIPKELGVSLILNSLNKDYDQFVQNYNMHSMRKSIVKLHAMLKLHEKGIWKKAETLVVLAIWEGKI